ncbi:J domain-containing protein [Salinibaculum salinum]|uniref:J domain-containing protein n=1 Tax=Salinibaculum salinum TaxID=3131996 RepID=UPI0030ED7C99
MGESFYSVLGVDGDADRQTIRRAYREQVKEHHPDVSDDPGAPEQFKRLTTARDVLVDGDERQRYDRLGHAKYVSQHVESSAWQSSPEQESDATERSKTDTETARSASDGGYDRTAWLGEDTPGKQRTRRRQHARAAGATATAEEWQRASQTYQRADTDVGSGNRSTVRNLLAALRSVGPWLLVHVIFVGSAAATSWLAFSQIATHVDLSWPTLLLGVALVGMTLFVSVLHVISELYS